LKRNVKSYFGVPRPNLEIIIVLKFHPKPGAILVCDYRGFVEPEMVKTRLCFVVSPRLRKRKYLNIFVKNEEFQTIKICVSNALGIIS
jgi:hypothetical protein